VTITDTDRLLRELMLRTLFQSLSGDSLARMTELLVPRSIADGEVLFSAGEPSERFWFVVEGKVTLERPGAPPWVFGPRSVVGSLDAFRERPYTRSCRALAESDLLELRRTDWLDLLEDDALVARDSITSIAARVHQAARAAPAQPVLGLARPAISTPGPFSTFQKILILRQARFLANAGMQAIASLTALASEHQLAAGQGPADAGLRLDRLYVLVTGRVELEGTSVRERGPGDLLGGPGVLSDPSLAAAARAVVPTVLLGIDQQDYYDFAEEHPRLSSGTLAYLASELEALVELSPPKE
jgi:CRP-like cAMP-binding protein